ncbi:MAG TPA: VCBS repeat-containing protein, partial [Pyrinomonadaceae bacterium]|nr:VCBS repeat-containing protein [Pyrinomonadaceae bacterium]
MPFLRKRFHKSLTPVRSLVLLLGLFGLSAVPSPGAQFCGAASFEPSANYGVGNNPNSVVVADFNNDGKNDLATQNTGNVVVLLGTGAGTFAPPANFPVSGSPYDVAAGDFNGDGKTDLVAVLENTNKVAIFLGDGAGGFAAPATFNVGTLPRSVAVGEFNGDGKSDLAVTNGAS